MRHAWIHDEEAAMSKCLVNADAYAKHFKVQRIVTTGLRALRNDNVIGAIGVAMEAEAYRPCQNCGSLTDSGVCSDECASDLAAARMFKERLALGQIDEEGHELGDFCIYCTAWFSYRQCGENAIYCDDPTCIIEAENDK